jgi:hypothetical protein
MISREMWFVLGWRVHFSVGYSAQAYTVQLLYRYLVNPAHETMDLGVLTSTYVQLWRETR